MRTLPSILALASLSLVAQQSRPTEQPATPPPVPPTLAQGLAIREAFNPPPKGPRTKSLGLPSRAVVIEGSPVEIPDPPKTVGTAKAHLREVEANAIESLAFLDSQLKRFYEDQEAQLKAAKADPAAYREGLDTPLHKELWSLVHGSPLKAGEQGLVKSMQDQMELQKTRAERDEQQIQAKARMERVDGTDAYDWEKEDRHRYGALRKAIAWEGDEFLKGYRPSWESYAPRLDTYIQTSARLLMELQAKPQPPSTQLLGRLLEIQVYERCRALIDLNTQIWRMAAAKVLEPRQWYLAENRGSNIITGSRNATRVIPVL